MTRGEDALRVLCVEGKHGQHSTQGHEPGAPGQLETDGGTVEAHGVYWWGSAKGGEEGERERKTRVASVRAYLVGERVKNTVTAAVSRASPQPTAC